MLLHLLHETDQKALALDIHDDDQFIFDFLGKPAPNSRHVFLSHFVDDRIDHQEQGIFHNLTESLWIEAVEYFFQIQKFGRHEIEADRCHFFGLGGYDALVSEETPRLIFEAEEGIAYEF